MAVPLTILSSPGNAVVAAMLTGTFALSTRSYGFITSLPFWFNFLQVLLTPLLAQRPEALDILGLYAPIARAPVVVGRPEHIRAPCGARRVGIASASATRS